MIRKVDLICSCEVRASWMIRSSIEKGEYICDFCNEGDSGPDIASDLFQHSVTSG